MWLLLLPSVCSASTIILEDTAFVSVSVSDDGLDMVLLLLMFVSFDWR